MTTSVGHPSAGQARTGRGAEIALVVFGALVLSGPPRLRARELDTALDSPFALDPAAMVQVVTWVGSAAVVIYLLTAYRRHRRLLPALLRNPPIRWYLMFGFLALGSSLWSVSPFYTMFFAAKLILGVPLVVLLTEHGRKASFDRPLKIMFFVYWVKLVVQIVLFFVSPHLVIGLTVASPLGYRLTGGSLIEDYGNSAQFVGLWLLTVALFNPSVKKRRLAVVAYFASWLPLLLAQGRTAIVLALSFVVIMVSLAPTSRGKLVFIALGVAALTAAILGGQIHKLIGVVTRGGDGFKDFSGRTDAFNFLIPIWKQEPLLGFGYAAGVRIALLAFVATSGRNIGNGHDIVSTVLVDLGLVGLVVLSLALFATWRQTLRLWPRTRGLRGHRIIVAQLTCLTVWITMNSAFGSGIEVHNPTFLALVGTAFGFRRQASRSAAAEGVGRVSAGT